MLGDESLKSKVGCVAGRGWSPSFAVQPSLIPAPQHDRSRQGAAGVGTQCSWCGPKAPRQGSCAGRFALFTRGSSGFVSAGLKVFLILHLIDEGGFLAETPQ